MDERANCPNCGGWRSQPWSAGLKLACSDCGAVWTRGQGPERPAAPAGAPARATVERGSSVVMPMSPTVRRALRLSR